MSLTHKSEQRAIVASYAHTIVDIAEQLGCEPQKLLEESDIPKEPSRDPLGFITLSQYEALLRNALAMSDDPALGLKIGRGITFGHHGRLAFAALSYPTIWDAMKIGRKFSRLMNQVIEIQLEEGPDHCHIRLESPGIAEDLYRIVIDMVMAMFCQQFKFMLKGDTEKLESMTISFRYDESCYGDQYAETIEPHLEFQAAANKITIPRSLALHPLEMADPIIANQFEEECDRLLKSMEEDRDMADQVRRLLFMATDGFPSINEVAEQLHVSPRTLRRRLQDAGSTYQKILDDVRLQLAQRYLTDSSRTIGEIAYILGYKDQNSFSYSFKLLASMSPSHYRQKWRS